VSFRSIFLASAICALLPITAVSAPKAGDYLAARQAALSDDFATGVRIANVVRSVNAARANDWAAVFAQLESGEEVGPLVDGLTQSWAFVGQGKMSAALESFDTLSETPGMSAYTQYHKALALAYVGDFEGADALFKSGPNVGMRYTRRAAITHAQILSQLGQNEDALNLINGIFGTPFTIVRSAQDGLSEVYLAVAQVLAPDQNDKYTLRFARAAMALNPANTDAVLLTAGLLDDLAQYDLATTTYGVVSVDDPANQSAQLGRSEALRKAGRIDEAIAVLEGLVAQYPDMPRVHAAAADLYREAEDLPAAKESYTTALSLYDTADPIKWFIHYARGITNHSLDDWPAAEADFRAALDLNPDQPQVLNYLGYSMVERDINLDEALGMIETAVAAEPQNGTIVDSLGWVLFQLGKFDEAVGHLENAASLVSNGTAPCHSIRQTPMRHASAGN